MFWIEWMNIYANMPYITTSINEIFRCKLSIYSLIIVIDKSVLFSHLCLRKYLELTYFAAVCIAVLTWRTIKSEILHVLLCQINGQISIVVGFQHTSSAMAIRCWQYIAAWLKREEGGSASTVQSLLHILLRKIIYLYLFKLPFHKSLFLCTVTVTLR